MAALAILNPRAKTRTRKATKKRRRKMTAKQLKFFGPRKSKKIKTRRRDASKKAKKSEVIIVNTNPKGSNMAKKTRHLRRKAKKVFTHPTGKKRYRRNPRSFEAGFLKNTLLPAAIGAAGAMGSDALLQWAPIPPQYKSGPVGLVLKIASSLAVGAAVGMISSREAGEEAAAGGIIVTLYGLSRGFLAQSGVSVPHSAGMGRYVPMRRYVPMAGQRQNGRPGLAYYNPARVAPMNGNNINRGNMRFLATR